MNPNSADVAVTHMVEASAQSILDTHHSLGNVRSPADKSNIWKEFADSGLLGLGLPEELGGAGFGARGYVQIAKLFGRELVSSPFIAQSVLPCYITARIDDGNLRDELLAYINAETKRVSFAGTEINNSIDPFSISTKLTDTGVFGEKAFVALPASAFIVTAQAGDELCLAFVESTEHGVNTDNSQNLLNEKVGRLMLDGATPKYDPLAGSDIENIVRCALDLGALVTAAQLAGVSHKAFDITLEYLRTRKQFNQSIGSFQAIQHRAVDLYIAQQFVESSIQRAAELFDEDPCSTQTQQAISCAKARASETALLMSKETIQLHGAIGFTDEADIGLYARASLCLMNQFGSTIAHQRRVYDIERARRGK